MLIDASEVPNGALIQSDLCIVEGGVAGVRVAREFALASFGVCMLESSALLGEEDTPKSVIEARSLTSHGLGIPKRSALSVYLWLGRSDQV